MKGLKKFVGLLLVVALCLAHLGLAQRGGGSGRSSSSSSSSSSRSSYYHSHSTYTRTPTNCTTVNGTTTCVYDDSTEGSWTVVIIIVVVVIGLAVIGYFSETKNVAKRKAIIEGSLTDFEARMEEWPSTLDLNGRQALIDQFMSKKYTMVITVKNSAEKFHCQVKVTDLSKESDNRYRIKMEGSDEVGSSKFDGVIVFTQDRLSLKLSKVYDDRTKAGQTEDYQNLLYEGTGHPDRISGDWAFHGFESSLQYSGTWYMM